MDLIKQVGTRFDDTLIGTDGDDKLLGKKGNDLLFGRAGNDRLNGGAGNDELLGEEGDDTLRGGKGRDVLDGGSGNDDLKGGAGDDVLLSSEGIDRLLGNAGNDRFKIGVFEAGYFLDGGRENRDGDENEAGSGLTGDTLDLSELDLTNVDRVFVDLDIENQGALNPAPPSQNGILRIDRGGIEIEIEVDNVENIIGSSFGETLFGNQENNVILGGAGDDRIHPFGGVDFVDGGDGIDTFLLNAAPQGVSIDFERGTAGPNTFVNFENANGSAVGDDAILGDANVNVLNGLGGNDELNGRGGGDTLEGGTGFDRFVFDGDPFDGIDVSAPGRQIVGNEDFIVDFSLADDRIVLNSEDFEVSGELSFFNGLAEDLPSGGVNLIVLQNSDNDDNPDTPFLAGTAANLIAERVDEAGAGFFVYFNSNLGLNRLVYSTDLSDASADLKIVARLTNLEGEDAIDALSAFERDNFAFIGDNVDEFGIGEDSDREVSETEDNLGRSLTASSTHNLDRLTESGSSNVSLEPTIEVLATFGSPASGWLAEVYEKANASDGLDAETSLVLADGFTNLDAFVMEDLMSGLGV